MGPRIRREVVAAVWVGIVVVWSHTVILQKWLVVDWKPVEGLQRMFLCYCSRRVPESQTSLEISGLSDSSSAARDVTTNAIENLSQYFCLRSHRSSRSVISYLSILSTSWKP